MVCIGAIQALNSIKIKPAKLSDVIVEQLEQMIIEGTYRAGQKFPPERELAKQFDVSRPSLREAIQKLEAKGLVTRKQGGGTFVSAQMKNTVSDPLADLLNRHPESQFDLLEFRQALEGISAFYAALRGTEADHVQIQQRFEELEAAQATENLDEEAKSAFRFYLAIAEASHNLVLLHFVRSLEQLLEKNIRQNLEILKQRPDVAVQIKAHRRFLVDAMTKGEPDKAQSASNAHLAYIEEIILEISKEKTRVERSLRRNRQKS